MLRSRWLRRFAIVLALGGIGFIAFTFLRRDAIHREGVQRRTGVVAEIEAKDSRWQLQDIEADRGVLPDHQNSTLLVAPFKAALVKTPFQKSNQAERTPISDAPPNQRLSDDAYAAIDAEMKGNEAALAIAREFRKYPRGLRRYVISQDVIGTLLPELQETRIVYQLLDLEAERLSADQRHGSALQLVSAIMNASRSIDREPFTVSCLIRFAGQHTVVRRLERTLGQGVPRGKLAELQTELMRESETNIFWDCLRSERAGLHELLTKMQNGVLPADLYFMLLREWGPTPPRRGLPSMVAIWLYEPHLPNDHAVYLETMTKMYEVRSLPEHEQRAALKAIPIPPDESGTVLSHALCPSSLKLFETSIRIRADLRCAATAIAVERFRQAHDRWPESLAEISKEILPKIPLDPIDGKPLRYLKRVDGVTIYSLGLDEKDDGGLLADTATGRKINTDFGCRLYNPDRRGLPAAPSPSPEVATGSEIRLDRIAPAPREVDGR
jgi:hypothetical protein